MYQNKKFKKNKGFHKTSGQRIAGLSIRVYVCERCGTWARGLKPAQCIKCGNMSFIHFGSQAEAKRWAELLLLEGRGVISQLERQKRFSLNVFAEKEWREIGKICVSPIKVGEYVSDFHYYHEKDGRWKTEDVKGGAITDLAAWKLRHFAAQYGYEVDLIKR